VIPSDFDESLVPTDLAAGEHVVYSSLMKARDVAAGFPDALVIAADTIVVVDGEILGKPSDAGDAARMLRLPSGRTHQVFTGVTVAAGARELSAHECTDVTFTELSNEVISRYLSTGEPMDKAGAYAIQGRASVLIRSVSGCYFNVVGLPVFRLSRMLEEFGVQALGA